MFWRYFLILTLMVAGIATAQEPAAVSQVYYGSDGKLVQHEKVSKPVVKSMVDHLVMALTQKGNVNDAWRSLCSPTDVVGIKVSAGGGATSGTHPEIVEAIAEGLNGIGIPRDRIIVWDRRKQDLLAAGFSTKSDNYNLRWVDADGDGYDKKKPLSAPVLGKLIWGDNDFKSRAMMRFSDLLDVDKREQLSDESYVARILTRRVTKVINVAALIDSYYTGVGGAIPSMVLGNLDNWRRFIKPPYYGNPYLAEVYADPLISGKVVLTLLDAIVVQYAGGPFSDPRFASAYLSIYMSKDPVAIDAIAMNIIDEFRVANKLPKIQPISSYIQSAASLGLGNFEESKIHKTRVSMAALQ